MYDPVTQLLWDAGRQWFGLSRSKILNSPDKRDEFIELCRGFKGYNRTIDAKVDALIKELEEYADG